MRYLFSLFNKSQVYFSFLSSTLLCTFGIGPFLVSLPFWKGEIPSPTRPLQYEFLQWFLVSGDKYFTSSLRPDEPYCYTHTLGQPSPQDGTIPFTSSLANETMNEKRK